MSVGQWLAMNVTPLLLRLGLAAVFIWAGYGKLAYNDPVSGSDAAILANIGVIKMATALPAPASPEKPKDEAPAVPDDSAPNDVTNPTETPRSPPAEPKPDGTSRTSANSASEFVLIRAQSAQNGSVNVAPTAAPFAAEDFPTPVMVPRLYQIALVLHKAAHPVDPAQQLWPTALAEAGTIRMLAWLAALTEVAGGALVLFGFLTRLASLGLAGTMVVAMLLTSIGPAAVSGTGFLGFLPQPAMSHAEGSGMAWMPMMFQWSMLTASLGLFFAGAGGLSLDRLIFGRSRPKPAPAPKAV